MGAQDVLKRHRFGAKPADADAADERLRQIHQLSAPSPAPAGMREISKFERETLVEALTQIDAAEKRAKAAEQKLAESKPAPVAAPLSYRATVTNRDAAGDMRRIELVPSTPDGMPYRINVIGRDGAGFVKTLELVPGKRMPT
jgi:hypothetical protein